MGVWALFLGFAVVNGLFRETVLEPHLGPETAHFLATTTLAGFVFFGTLLFVGLRSDVPAQTDLVGVGILWAALTALLELGLSRAGRRRVGSLSRLRLLARTALRTGHPGRAALPPDRGLAPRLGRQP